MTGIGDILASAGKGAASGIALGPVGAVVGGLLAAGPGLLDSLGVHLFGDQGEAVAAAALDVVKDATGQDAPTPLDVSSLRPDQTIALRVQLAGIAAGAEKARLDAWTAQLVDVQSARARDAAVTAGGKRNVRADIMLSLVGAGLLACILSASFGHLNEAALSLVSGAAGILLGCFKDAFGFEFGSSRGSEQKTDIIANLADRS